MTTRAPSPSIPVTTPIRSSKTYYHNVQKLKKWIWTIQALESPDIILN